MLLKAFDSNKDLVLTPDETAALLKALDTIVVDGKISLEEWKAYLLAHPELLPVRDGDGSGGTGPGPGPQP